MGSQPLNFFSRNVGLPLSIAGNTCELKHTTFDGDFPFLWETLVFHLKEPKTMYAHHFWKEPRVFRRARRRASRLGFSVKILLPVASTAVTVNKTACLNYTDTSVVWFSVAMTKYRPLGRKSFTEKSYTGFSGPCFWAIRDAQSRSSSFKKRVLSLFCGWLTRRWFFSMGFEIERAE